MDRRVGATAVILAGAVLFAVVVAQQLVTRAGPFEETTSDFAESISPGAVQALRADLQALEAAGDEFEQTAIPLLAQRLNITPQQASALLQSAFPEVGVGVAELPSITGRFDRLVGVMEAQGPNLLQARGIPTENITAVTVPWALIGAGLAAILLGFAMMGVSRTPALGAIVLGLGMLLVPLILSLPEKSAAADDLNMALDPVYTRGTLDQAAQDLATVQNVAQGFQTALLPSLAEQIGIPPEQLAAEIAPALPALTGAIADLPNSTARFQATLQVFERNLANYREFSPVTLEPIAYLTVFAGVACMVGGGWALVAMRGMSADARAQRRVFTRGRRAA